MEDKAWTSDRWTVVSHRVPRGGRCKKYLRRRYVSKNVSLSRLLFSFSMIENRFNKNVSRAVMIIN